jgi:hypothetical protein
VKLMFYVVENALGDDLRSLYEWLRRSDQLPGSPVSLVARPGQPGEMGGAADLVVQLAPAELLTFATVVAAWLKYRTTDVDVERAPDGGYKVRISRLGRRAAEHAGGQLIDLLRKASDGDSGPVVGGPWPLAGAPHDDGSPR